MIFYRFTHSRNSMGVFCLMLLALMFCLAPCIPAEILPYMRIQEMVFTLLFIFNPFSDKLRMDDAGISCFNRRHLLWYVAWEEVDRVRTIPVNRHRGYCLVLKREMAQQYCFEHTRRIEDVLKKYGCQISKN